MARLKLKSVWNVDVPFMLDPFRFSVRENFRSPAPERSVCPILFLERKVEADVLTS